MLYNLARPLADQFILFNLFRYITFRSGAACLTALVVSFITGPEGDPLAANRCSARASRSASDGPERHLIEKKGTPTMGGVLILFALTISTLLWVDLRNALCLGGAVRHLRLRLARLRRRLPEAVASATTRASPAASSCWCRR